MIAEARTMPHAPPTDVPAPRHSRRQTLLLVLGGFFVGNALLAEIVGGKLFQVPTGLDIGGEPFSFTLSCGVILWPVVFVLTDVLNEYFGRPGVKRLSILAALIIAYAFVALWLTEFVPAAAFSPVDDASFRRVLLQSQWIIVGSITAFLLAQLIDVTTFWIIRRHTGARFLWMRATGSTVVSQLVDTFVVGFIGLYLPARLGAVQAEEPFTFVRYLNTSLSGYTFKFLVAVGATPALYVLHTVIDRYLGGELSGQMINAAAAREG
jgi:hypothetical protein